MRRVLLLPFILVCSLACNNPSRTEDSKVQTTDTAFRNWLGKYGLSASDISDTFSEAADSLWDYALPLSRIDSLYAWHPSTDSSYYLLTNIAPNTGKSLFKEGDDTEYRFLDRRNKKVHIGITLLNEGPLTPVDIFWQGGHTIFLLAQNKTAREHKLIRLDMLADTIWSYRMIR